MKPVRETNSIQAQLQGVTEMPDSQDCKKIDQDLPAVTPVVRGRVLLIAYHFPPDASSTGRLRTLGFMRHLPACGWQPAVLTAHRRAYGHVDEAGIADIPQAHPVCRAFALDARRHLAWRGKYLSLLATPDRWIYWWPDAVRQGLSMIRTHKIDVIWSTFPILTSHLVGLSLSRRTGLPWIADFRDPVISKSDNFRQRVRRRLERRVVENATRLVFTTPGAKRLYTERFQNVADASKFSVIPNGYEEETFQGLERPKQAKCGVCTLVHGGVLYRRGRNPQAFFEALAMLKTKGVVSGKNLRVVLRASGHEAVYQAELDCLGLSEIVEMAPKLSHQKALEEQAAADGLLLFQGSEFNVQIPAKVYEYLRIGAPIFALVDAEGDTAALLREIGGATSAPLQDATAIATALEAFLSKAHAGALQGTSQQIAATYSRSAGAVCLAGLLDELVER